MKRKGFVSQNEFL